MINKLILGTAGLSGTPYGLGKRVVSLPDSVAVISHALACGFTAIDTAPAYGHAEQAIGMALRARQAYSAPRPTVYTKTAGDEAEAMNSIGLIGVLPVFLWHNWIYGNPFPPEWVEGVTTYANDLPVSHVMPFELIQCDWNILNQNADSCLRKFIARSVFLQGLLMGGGSRLQEEVRLAVGIAASLGVTLPALALWSALNNPKISNVVVGCSSIGEVDTILRILEKPVWTSTAIKILHVGGPETDPRTWK